MDDYIIFACPRCGTIRYAKEGQKTARCLKCGYQMQVHPDKVKVFGKARDSREAVEIVKALKTRLKR